MGSEPVESEIPITISDLPEEVQLAFDLYHYLPDRWEFNSGTYLGKDITGITGIMDIIGTDDRRTALIFIRLIDAARIQYLMEKQKTRPKG